MAQFPSPTPTLPVTAAMDPLAGFKEGAVDGNGAPIPLVATRIRVLVTAGLAVVRTERVFRNAEAASIEATLTFPVPVQATLFGLRARIGDRVLAGTARRREAARAAYEDAVDSGKTAVLHEEALRGVHVISIAHIPPGAEVTVASDWASPLAAGEAGAATLRIPTTVGAVYGRSPLVDSDDLVTDGGVLHEATLEVTCAEGIVTLVNGPALLDGCARLKLNRPIDLRVTDWAQRPLEGLSASGSQVTLTIAPAPRGEMPLDAVVLVDRSGSMGDSAGAVGSLHDAVIVGLRAAAGGLAKADKVNLWQFDHEAEAVLPPRGRSFLAAVNALGAPRGGTEIGYAIARVLADTSCHDVVLITDGQSWELDVQALARSGRRFTVVLVGSSALAANVGHLAALSGGQVFVSEGADTGEAVRLALASLRLPHVLGAPLEQLPAKADALLGGMRLVVSFDGEHAVPAGGDDPLPRAVAAVAAALVLPRLPEAAAAALAEAEGLCGHLTSLVLVDEAGALQEGIPVQRKVALMAPAYGGYAASVDAPAMPMLTSASADESRRVYSYSLSDEPSRLDLTFARGQINWATYARLLRKWDAASFNYKYPEPMGVVLSVLLRASRLAKISNLADELGVPPMLVAIALLAVADAGDNRSAARLARQVLGKISDERIDEALAAVGLSR